MSLVLEVFNDKVICALQEDGKEETAKFISIIVQLWKIFNVKSPYTYHRLNDRDRRPIDAPNCHPVLVLNKMADSLNHMATGHGKARRHSLTSATRDAIVQSISGIVEAANELITNNDFSYVLTSQFHSDTLEGEFGIYRQLSGGNYFICVEQVMQSATFRQMKFIHNCELILTDDDVVCENHQCCELNFTEEELLIMDNVIRDQQDITEHEKSAIFFICGYVAFKHNFPNAQIVLQNACEFTQLVSRGKLRMPSDWLLTLAQFCYSLFIKLNPICSNRVVRMFEFIADSFYLEHIHLNSICRTLSNTFFKGYVRKITEANEPFAIVKELTERKIAKLKS